MIGKDRYEVHTRGLVWDDGYVEYVKVGTFDSQRDALVALGMPLDSTLIWVDHIGCWLIEADKTETRIIPREGEAQ